MNKKLSEMFKSYGMTVEKNSAYGIVNGFEVSASLGIFDTVEPLKLHIAFFATDEQKRNIEAALGAVRGSKHATRYGLYWGLNDLTYGRLVKNFPDMLKTVMGAVEANGGIGFGRCPVCGHITEGEAVKKCNIDGFTVTIEDCCVDSLNAELNEENAKFDNAPNNYLRGFLGALVGGIVGGGLAALCYVIGFVTAITAAVAAVLGAFLYQKFGGKPNKAMIAIVSATTLVCMLLAFFIVYLVASQIALNDLGISSLSAFDGLALALEDKEFSTGFYTDLALLFVFTALGIFFVVFYMARRVKRRQSINTPDKK